MQSKKKSTKERILEEALKLFAQNGYLGTSMNDIAREIGVTKAALYKHYTSKQEILDSIIQKMNEMDQERTRTYAMPEGDMEKVVEDYKNIDTEKIKQFTRVQFLHWTEEKFSSDFRKMLTLEQYRDVEMKQLYQKYLAKEPFFYMEHIFSGFIQNAEDVRQLALEFYGPIFLLYSIYDGGEEKENVLEMLDQHIERFVNKIQKMENQ